MKLKKIKKHVKKVKITMKFDSIEAANAMYARIKAGIKETAITMPNTYIRVERWEKKPKIVVTASGREAIEAIL